MPTEYRDDPNGNDGAASGAGGNAGDGIGIDPAIVGGTDAAPAAPAPKRRGRPPGSGRTSAPGTETKKVKSNSDRLDLSGIHALFVSTHVVLAKATGVPELTITDAEGEQFLKACENVARHYSVTTTQKTLDWLALIGAGVQIYGTRAMVIIADRKKPNSAPAALPVAAPVVIVPEPEEHH
jgi:hypothetical protein